MAIVGIAPVVDYRFFAHGNCCIGNVRFPVIVLA